jgi:predicted ATPase
MPPYWPWRRISRDLALDDPFAAGDAGRVDELDRQLLFAAVVELAGLDRAAVATLVARVAGGPAPVAAGDLWARTGGNPFFVREVVWLLLAQGDAGSPVIPAGVREVLGRRLARLSQACHALLSAAAVTGDPIDEAVVAAVSGRDEAAVLRLLDEAARSRLVVHDPLQPRPFRFTHALVREVPRAA